MGPSHARVHCVSREYGLQPRRVERFKFGIDPEFGRKLADIARPYLDPRKRALVLSVDERSQIQATNRTQPLLPMCLGLPARGTHDYTCHGTTNLYAALEVASGKSHARCAVFTASPRRIVFLNSLARCYLRRPLRLACNNYGTHTHPAVRQWRTVHARFRVHFTLVSTS